MLSAIKCEKYVFILVSASTISQVESESISTAAKIQYCASLHGIYRHTILIYCQSGESHNKRLIVFFFQINVFLTAEGSCSKNTLHHLSSVCLLYTATVQQYSYFQSGWFEFFPFLPWLKTFPRLKHNAFLFKQITKPILATANHTYLPQCGENDKQRKVILDKSARFFLWSIRWYDCYQKIIYKPRFTGKCTSETAFPEKRSVLFCPSKTQ